MDSSLVEKAAALLVAARRENKMIDGFPEDCRPRNLEDAYAIQNRFVDLLGWEVGGWFCACTNKAIQDMLNLQEPYYARLFNDYILPSPAELRAADFPPILLECEFAFRLKDDLPKRQAPYTRSEVAAAVRSVHPSIEVVAGHIKDWPNKGVFSVIADNGTDGALVVGEGVEDWRDLDLVTMAVTLSVNGQTLRRGRGSNVLGDPMAALVWLANARSRDGDGLRAGDIHNTGTATDIYWADRGDHAVVEFEGLGSVTLKIA